MPRPANPTTPEAATISKALEALDLKQAVLADELDVSPGFISQFVNGNRPVPWDKAIQLGPLLGLLPEDVSAEYRRIKDHFGVSATGRMTADVVTAAIALARELSGQKGKSRFDIESNPDVFATAVNRILATAESSLQRPKVSELGEHESTREIGEDDLPPSITDGDRRPATNRAKKRG